RLVSTVLLTLTTSASKSLMKMAK
ncbi:bacterial NAD-glutamate dehydrogenase family protein, partial [Vibrio parahaemolyticus V-223/04]